MAKPAKRAPAICNYMRSMESNISTFPPSTLYSSHSHILHTPLFQIPKYANKRVKQGPYIKQFYRKRQQVPDKDV